MANIYNLSDDWTDSGTVYDAIKIDVTDTASDATSKLLDLQVGSSSKFKVDKGGNVTFAGSISGLDQVDNTSDVDKPVSTLQASAIGVVQSDVNAHEARVDNPHSVTATQVGLGNVTNTSDADKPVSTLQQAAISAVQSDIDSHEALTDNPHGVTATQVGLGNVDNTSDLAKPVSTLQAQAISAVQSDIDTHEALTDNPHTVTAAQVGLGNVDNTSDLDKPISTLTQAAIDAAGGGAFGADANTQITPSTPIVLDQATGDEAALTLDYTTNKATSGNDTGLIINQTDTLSPGTSNLLDLQVGGASRFNVGATGEITGADAVAGQTSGLTLGNGVAVGSGYNYIKLRTNWGDRTIRNWGGWFRFNSGIVADGSLQIGGADSKLFWSYSSNNVVNLALVKDADNTLAQRNGVNAQTYNIYNTYTSATSYERAHIGWNDTNDTFVIGTEAGSGGGTVRDVALMGGDVGIGTTTPTVALDVSGSIAATGTIKATPTIVAALPAASTAGAGARTFVTDSANSLSSHHGQTVSGGGANFSPVYSDGTNWLAG